MPPTRTVGLVGFGRICRALYEYVEGDPDVGLGWVLVRSETEGLPSSKQRTDPAALADEPVDLVVEGATPEALGELHEALLDAGDLMVLSGSAFADPDVQAQVERAASERDRAVYLPHAALLGVDGLVDARSELETVSITATKAPDHLDFSYTDAVSPADVTGRAVLYEGPVRGLCKMFPRNFNSHAGVALASLGLDETTSKLIADPAAESADHVIRASGEGFDLEITRKSAIEGVTGDYTLVSIWGSIRRVLGADEGLRFV
jgi:aspartate dehydrogenase